MNKFEELAKPFPQHKIHWRVGSTNRDGTKGIGLAYIDARDVMERLDFVLGPDGWMCDYPWSDGGRVVCRIGIKIAGEWIYKTNGAGETKYEADKGALSDAFKRAAVLWGVGRYLYGLPNTWVEIEARGKTSVITKNGVADLNKSLASYERSVFMVSIDREVKRRVYTETMDMLANGDDDGLKQIWAEFSPDEKAIHLWPMFNSQERSAIKAMTK